MPGGGGPGGGGGAGPVCTALAWPVPSLQVAVTARVFFLSGQGSHLLASTLTPDGEALIASSVQLALPTQSDRAHFSVFATLPHGSPARHDAQLVPPPEGTPHT